MSSPFDAIVIGTGPAGETAVSRLAGQGMRVALCERELIGGECAYWACIPSKTLLSPPEARSHAGRSAGLEPPEQHWRELAAYRDEMIRHLDDGKQVAGYEGRGVAVYKGEARLAGPGRVEVAGEALEADRIVVATGSGARIPSIDGLEEAGYWTNREATTLTELPDSVIVLGGGPVGIELGQFLRRFGVGVTLVESHNRLLSREDPTVSELIEARLRDNGVELRLGASAAAARREDGRRTLTLDGGGEVSGEELLVATGRAPRVNDIGLETVGIEADPAGIRVDGRCRAAEGVWAVGDVTGVMPFTHVGTYQSRIACADIAGEDVSADYRAIPRVVFSDPEIAAVGLTAQQACEQGFDVAFAHLDLASSIARPSTYETTPQGELGLIADRDREVLVGAWAVAPLAGEWIHQAMLAVKAEIPLRVLRDTAAQFPTFSEAYRQGVEQLGV